MSPIPTSPSLKVPVKTGEPIAVNAIAIDNLDVPIYRVFTTDRFFEMFSTRKLVLVRPHLWEDPFENFLYRVKVKSKDGSSVSLDELRKALYGQCWSFTKASDAMWRIYAPCKNGVKVRTTARKLLEAIYNKSDKFASLKFFIGRVSYLSERDLKKLFLDPLSMITDTSGRGPILALLCKRKEFGHEKEARLIYHAIKDSADDIKLFTIDPFELFDEVVFDPRMSEHSYLALKAYLRNLGFSKRIIQSALYRLPQMGNPIVI